RAHRIARRAARLAPDVDEDALRHVDAVALRAQTLGVERLDAAKEAVVRRADPDVAVVVDGDSRPARRRQPARGAEDEPVVPRQATHAVDAGEPDAVRQVAAEVRRVEGVAGDRGRLAEERDRTLRLAGPRRRLLPRRRDAVD